MKEIPVTDGKRKDRRFTIHENEEPQFKLSIVDEDLKQLKEQRQEDFRHTRFREKRL